MARKVKTPPPPRRAVQAPKLRTTPRDDTRNRKIFYAVGASGFLMLALVAGFLLFAGSGEDDAAAQQNTITSLREAGWTVQQPKSQGRDHVPALPENFKYNTVPGTSGPHSNQTAIYGAYDQQISEMNYVHNLEHGAVGLFYGPGVPDETVQALQEFYAQDPSGLILAPDPRLGDQVAMTAWTRIAKGKTFNEDIGNLFVDQFGFRGPESCKSDIEQGCFRRENLQPGNQ
jgi:hypothetical protein